jgi:hypothetical protein
MKILLFCPAYERNGLDEFWPDSQASFAALLAPAGVEVTRMVGRDNPYDIRLNHRYRNTLHQFQNAQRAALEGGFDALCTFESDMIVPADGLIQLWGTPEDVVYGLYVLRHGSNVVNAFRMLEGSPNIDQSVSLFPELYAQGMRDGRLRVSGCGMGFTLIRRVVLERFAFRNYDEGSFAPDWALASDCQAAGIEQVARFDVQCGHIEDNGLILWPGRNGATVKVLVRETFTRGVVYTAGETAEMPTSDALEMNRCGFVTIVKEDEGKALTATPRRPVIEEATMRAAEHAVTRGRRK